MTERVRHIEAGQLEKYNGLQVEDISEENEYEFEASDGSDRLVRTSNGSF